MTLIISSFLLAPTFPLSRLLTSSKFEGEKRHTIDDSCFPYRGISATLLVHQRFPPAEYYKRGIRLSVGVSRQLIAISKQIIGAANLNVAPTTQRASLVTIYIVSTETRVRARRSLSLSARGTSSSRARRVALRIISLRH